MENYKKSARRMKKLKGFPVIGVLQGITRSGEGDYFIHHLSEAFEENC